MQQYLPSTQPGEFQSTPSTRRETGFAEGIHDGSGISIHSLHTEGDGGEVGNHVTFAVFQSTPSTRRETH